ncbi:MAG: VIT domain-containing protein [Deltaproteobacteria bacterium]|nr:VIT domain-containing protein [Deltaproteobacteria bacterium]
MHRTIAPALLAALLLGLTPEAHAGLARLSPSLALSRSGARLGSSRGTFPDRAGAAAGAAEDRTLAPYLRAEGSGAAAERLPLREVSAEVRIVGVIAQVKVQQVFENDGGWPIDAVYVFPGSTRAAVHGMRMTIGDRRVEARINEKAEARQQYEEARAEGKRASLLEQERPNVFTMRVANLMPGDRVEVELDYTELLVPREGDYEFVYPAVVGPRFTGGDRESAEAFAGGAHLPAGQPEPYRYDLEVRLESAIPIKALDSPTHELHVRRPSPESAIVDLAKSGGGDRDFVLRYRLAGDQIESGLLLYEDPENESEKYFLLMVEPPARPRPEELTPREFVFLLDVSGSMQGFPLDTAKSLMARLLGQLKESDYFNITFFSGGSWTMSEEGSIPASEENIEEALALVDDQRGGGGTQLMDGLRAAYEAPRPREAVSRSVIVVTDGYVNVETQSFKWVREHLDEANLFAFGIGSSVNRALIEGLARAGQGEPFVVLEPSAAGGVAEHLAEYVQDPVFSRIGYGFEDFRAVEVAPGKLPDLMARRPLILFGMYKGEAEGTITLEGWNADGLHRQVVRVEDSRPSEANAPLRHLWARKWISLLSDELAMAGDAPELVQMITQLGLSHRLLTQYTSFLAVDSAVVNPGGSSTTVHQPGPLPAGVPNQAVAAAPNGGTPTVTAPRRYAGGERSRATLQTLITGERTRALGTKRSRMIQVIKGGSGETSSASGGSWSGGSPPMPASRPETERTRTTYQTLLTGERARALGEQRQRMIEVHEGKSGKTEKVAARPIGDRDGPTLLVTGHSATLLSTPLGIIEALEKHFGGLARACFAKGKAIEVELSFDAEGKVSGVKVLGGDEVLGRCLAPKMKGLRTGVKVENAKARLTLELLVI